MDNEKYVVINIMENRYRALYYNKRDIVDFQLQELREVTKKNGENVMEWKFLGWFSDIDSMLLKIARKPRLDFGQKNSIGLDEYLEKLTNLINELKENEEYIRNQVED